MTNVFLRGSTWIIFVIISVLAVLVDVFASMFRVGTMRVGLPFRFYESTSAPPPAFGSAFYWKSFVLDLLIYYAIAVCITLIWHSLRSTSPS